MESVEHRRGQYPGLAARLPRVRARPAAVALAALTVLPRLGVLLVERGDVLASFTEKSDDFARTLVASGTFGFLPGEPSAYTQPLYGWFLAAVYWVGGRNWVAVGLAQVALALAAVLLVYAIGRRTLGATAGFLAAAAFALHPYLVWHDVHVNREVVDTVVAAGLVLALLVAAERRAWWPAAAAGGLAGLAILGNARLVGLPLLVAGWLAWRVREPRRAAVLAAASLVAAGLVLVPWVARNAVAVGCATVTTDARALWKANNPATRATLAGGGWIDDVPPLPGAPPSPEDAAAVERRTGREVAVDECAQMRLFRAETIDFWREQPGEKALLAAQAAGMLWDPRGTRTEEGPGAGGLHDTARTWLLPLYVAPLYALALLGAGPAPRRLAVPAALLLGYVTATAVVFAGATRYRAPWDFLLALLAAAAVTTLWGRYRAARAPR